VRSLITSFKGSPNVSFKQKIKHQAIIPKKAVGNQLFTPIAPDIYLMKGAIVLPSCPITLVHPNPKLRIYVG
jgi:hypothetical protein